MHYCSKCGTKQASDAQYCSKCGHSLAGAQGKDLAPKTNGIVRYFNLKNILIAFGGLTVIVILLGFFSGLLSAAPEKLISENNQYLQIINKDSAELSEILERYNSLSFESNFDEKAELAKQYGVKAQETIAHLDEFKRFINENKAALQNQRIAVPQTLADIESAKIRIQTNAKTMSDQLEQYAQANQAKQQIIGDILKTLLIGFI